MSSFTQIREEKTVRKIRRVTKTITTREVQEVYEEEVEEPELAIVRVWSLRRISWRTRRARVKLTCWRPSPPIHVSSLQGAYIVPKEVSHLCIICFDACCFCICYGGVCQSAVSPGRAHLTSSPSPFLSCLPPGSRCGQKTKAACKHGHSTTLWAGGWSEIPPLLREAAGRRARGSTAVLPDVFADSIHARLSLSALSVQHDHGQYPIIYSSSRYRLLQPPYAPASRHGGGTPSSPDPVCLLDGSTRSVPSPPHS